MKKYLTIIFLNLFLLGCGGNLFINKTYEITYSDKFNLATIPFSEPSLEIADSSLVNMFTDSSNFYNLIDLDKIQETITNDPSLKEILHKITGKKYQSEELKKNPNLNELISKSEINQIKEKLYNCDILFICPLISVSGNDYNANGYIKFRFYDLNSGSLILQNDQNINLNTPFPGAQIIVQTLLIAEARNNFKENILQSK